MALQNQQRAKAGGGDLPPPRAQILAKHGLTPEAIKGINFEVGSRDVAVDSLFGPTLCRATYLCRSCRNPFERFKPPADP